jgi:hypothetical protein
LPGPNLPLIGPGTVIGIDPRAIVRTDPATGATGVEDNHLALVELGRPDFPWLFTPASPGAANRLRPWLVLVVVDASTVELQPGTPLPRITVNDAQLPDINDAWGWAHAQVTVDDPATASQALVPPFGGAGVSRLLCPRRLQPDTQYLACIVPTTLVGAQAGLGLPLDPGQGLALAWTAGAGQDVTLPVYYSWTFSTGDSGDFKSLVQRLVGVTPSSIPGFGTRTIDVSSPWESPPQLGAGMTIELDGALDTGADNPGTLTEAARAAFETRLTGLLDFPATLQPTNPTNDPTLSAVAPPIYGAIHAGVNEVPVEDGWLRQLNLDPRRRIAAAFGTQYVQERKEFLMAQAWNQLGAVREANRLRAFAELAAEVADRLHARHVQTLGPSELFALAAPARTRVLVGAANTLQAAAAATFLPAGAATVAFTRFSRPLGPIGRRAYTGSTPTVLEQGLSGALRVAPPPSALDGIASLQTAPPSGQPATDATGVMVATAWQGITTTEQSIQLPSDLTAVRQALNISVGTRPGGWGLGGGTLFLIPTGPPPITMQTPTLAQTLTAALLPSIGILKRLDGRIQVPANLGGGNTTVPVMACPQFTAPLAMALLQNHLDYLLPGLGNFPDDSVTLLQTNGVFVEAFLVGANHEMNRELLWREYPTDRRGTPFRYFWPRPDGNPDIPPITNWPLTTALGMNGAGNGLDLENMIVLLVRGEVLRRYPRTIVYAAPGRIDGTTLTLDTSVQWTAPQFLLRLSSTTTAFAYPLRETDVRGIPGYYFVFSEPVTGPRFNFDETSSGPPQFWTDLAWDQVPQSRGFAIAGLDVAPPAQETGPNSPQWNKDAADMGRISFARPYRVGFHADQLLPPVID